jgi:mannose-6-phosphate isomerase-like protein (cupin superfamily)
VPYLYLTGLDERGRSHVAERRPLVPGAKPQEALRFDTPIPTVPEGPAETVLLESPTAPGGAMYNVYTWREGQRTRMHRTTTIDLDVVLQGSINMELETETVTLHAGDCVVLPGVAHAWISSAEGAVVLYGLHAGTPSGSDVERHREPFG